MDLGGFFRSYFGNGSDVMHLHDPETGERRLGRLEDVGEAVRLCDAAARPRLRHVGRLAGRTEVEEQSAAVPR